MYVRYYHTSIQIWNLTSEMQLGIVFFLLLCIDRMLNYGLKSQRTVLHANLQSQMFLTIFSILFGVFIFNSL